LRHCGAFIDNNRF